jgi:hypothetical protein
MSEIAEVSKLGDQRNTLVALRDRLAEAVDDSIGELAWMLPQVSAQLRQTMTEIAEIDAVLAKRAGGQGAQPGNEFSERRAGRKAAATTTSAAS